MNSGNSYELGRVVFSDIDENEYLNELYPRNQGLSWTTPDR